MDVGVLIAGVTPHMSAKQLKLPSHPRRGESGAAVTLIVLLRDSTVNLWRSLERVIARASCANASVSIVVIHSGCVGCSEVERLRLRAREGAFCLVEREPGEGLVMSVNAVLAQLAFGHVLLLDAEVELASGGLAKLVSAAQSQSNVASVTPFSNQAGLATVPFLQGGAGLHLMSVEALDAAAATANRAIYVPVSSASGCCVLLTQQALERSQWQIAAHANEGWEAVQRFCQHAGMEGMANLLACDTFVIGGCMERRAVSESPACASQKQEAASFDLLGAARVALCLQAMQQSSLPLILQVTHRIGGGVERHVRELHAVLEGRAWVMVLRPGDGDGVVRLSFGVTGGVDQLDFQLPDDAALLQQVLLGAGLARIHIHHVNGFPDQVWSVLLGLERPIDLTLHDYAIIAGSPTLTNGRGVYVGLRADGDYEFADAARAGCLQGLASAAQRCLVPTQDMQHRLSLALPELSTQVRSHPDRECFGIYPAPRAPRVSVDRPLRVLCIGALGREKGVEVLGAVASLAKRRGLPIEFSLLGSAHIPLGGGVNQLGVYADEQLPALLANEQPDLLWFPVQWPETWSYTLSAALEAGLPVLASSLGAFVERLQGRPHSWLQGHDCAVDDWLGGMLDIRQQFIEQSLLSEVMTVEWRQADVPAFYREGYLLAESAPCKVQALPSASHWQGRYVPHGRVAAKSGWRAFLLACGLRVREWPLVGRLLACVPYNAQRRIKRMLSSAPLR